MKKFLSIITLTLCCVLGAQADDKKTIVEFEDTQARMLNVESNAIFKPLVVEIELIPGVGKVRYEKKFDEITFLALDKNFDNVRSWGTFYASEEYNADVIVAATYDVTYNTEKREGKVIVVGYPAIFKNWHTVTSEDLPWIEAVKRSRDAERSLQEKIAPVSTSRK